jgi:hypothetical protein
MQKRLIRVLAIRTSDDDGTHKRDVKAKCIEARVNTTTQVFSKANIEFLFDPNNDVLDIRSTLLNRDLTVFDDPAKYTSKDIKPPFNSRMHAIARNDFAQLFPNRLCVFFRYRTSLEYDSNAGHWIEKEEYFGSSGWNAWLVNMGSIGGDNDLAHEIGHYLQIRHPFVEGVKTVSQAAERIRSYVEDQNHPPAEGLNALDGDRVWVLDTPADARGSIFEKVYGVGNKCGPNGTIDIPVNFNNPSLPSEEYILEPDRGLVMSYFKDCDGDKHISEEEALRVRDGLEQGLKHSLISLQSNEISGSVTKRGSANAGGIGAVDMAYIREGRVVTAVRTREKNLKLIVWDISSTGSTITRKGDSEAGEIDYGAGISCCSLGLGLVATSIADSEKNLEVIVWKVTTNGSVERKKSAKAGLITKVASCRLGIEFLATGVQTGNGKLRVIVWHISADGSIERKAQATAGSILDISMCGIDQEHFATHVRQGDGKLKTILWKYSEEGETLTRCNSIKAGNISDVSSSTLSRSTLVSAVRDDSNKLKLIAWQLWPQSDTIERTGSAEAGAISQINSCSMGTDLLATAMRDSANKLRVILWQVAASGDSVVRKGHDSSIEINYVAMCRAGHRTFATACKNKDNNFRIITWKI